MMSATAISDLDPYDPANHEVTDRLQYHSAYNQGVADRVGEQGVNVARTGGEHDSHNDGGQSHQQHHGEPSLSGVNAHLPQNFEALANHIGQIVKNFRQVAA